MRPRALRHGDLVEVRSAADILATLDDRGALDGLPFMPEMLAYCGRRLTVDKRTDKICDTIYYTGSRKLPDGVLLEDLRCDGSGHDGCQAECRIVWKEAWLRPVRPADPPGADPDLDARAALEALVARNTRAGDKYVCQNTELFNASPTRLPTWDPRPYLNEVTARNISIGTFIRVMPRIVVQEALRILRLAPRVAYRGDGKGMRTPPLNLQPGDAVRVKSEEGINATLNPEGKNRGLWFDREMGAYCGQTFRVRQRVNHFIDERTGEMVNLKSDCVTLDGAVCSGEHSTSRWFCPRAIYPYWREAWLERVEADGAAESAG